MEQFGYRDQSQTAQFIPGWHALYECNSILFVYNLFEDGSFAPVPPATDFSSMFEKPARPFERKFAPLVMCGVTVTGNITDKHRCRLGEVVQKVIDRGLVKARLGLWSIALAKNANAITDLSFFRMTPEEREARRLAAEAEPQRQVLIAMLHSNASLEELNEAAGVPAFVLDGQTPPAWSDRAFSDLPG